MITSVNKSNADKYSYLYERASEYLMSHKSDGTPLSAEDYGGDEAMMKYLQNPDGSYYLDEEGNKVKAPISSLQEYFSYIQELSSLDMVYTVLPLDEEHFEINADTREISVPEAFKTNGISVKGDEISEVVYFRINRFYDATDLGVKDIYIEWTAPNGDKGVSVPCVIDLDSEPNFIIFGWPLSSAITKEAGNVTFAVRFYTIDETSHKIDYSFATLTQTVAIKESLSYNLTSLKTDGIAVDNALNLIKGRFENTTPSGSTTTAKPPIYSLNMDEDIHAVGDPFQIENTEGGTRITYVSANLGLDEDGFTTQSFDAQVSAYAEDAGTITYVAQKLDFDDKNVVDFSKDPEVKMVVTADKTRKTGKLYYYAEANDEGVVAYKLYKYDLTEDAIIENLGKKQDIYEKVYAILVDGIGYYTVTATNRVRTAHAKTKSYTMVVPRPETPEIRVNLEKKNIFRDGLIYDPGNTYEMTLSVAGFTDRGKLTYQWCRLAPGETEFKPIPGATEPNLPIQGYVRYTNNTADVDGETVITSTNWTLLNEDGSCAGDGYYHCIITNNLNKEVDSISTNVIRVTHAATAPVVTLASNDTYSLSELRDEQVAFAINAAIPEESGELIEGWRYEDASKKTVVGKYTYQSADRENIVAEVAGWTPAEDETVDGITYEWYRYYTATGSTTHEDVEAAARGEYQISHDVNMYDWAMRQISKLQDEAAKQNVAPDAAAIAKYQAFAETAHQAQFDPLESGYYFCVATNTYNGTTASTISRFFFAAEA